MAKSNELFQIRQALKLNQTDMGALLGVKQAGYQRWEDDPDKPAAQAALEKAKAIYKERAGADWPGLRVVPPGTVGGQGWSLSPEQRKAEAVQRAVESNAGPTKRDRWLAEQVADNALRERNLFESATPGQHYLLVTFLANGIAAGSTPEELERGLNELLDMVEAAYRRAKEQSPPSPSPAP